MTDSNKKNYPPIHKQGENLAKFVWEVLNTVGHNGEQNNHLLVTKEVADARMEICKKCDSYDSEENRCFECGCWLKQKVRFAFDSCPLKKWDTNGEKFIQEDFYKLIDEHNLDKEKESE